MLLSHYTLRRDQASGGHPQGVCATWPSSHCVPVVTRRLPSPHTMFCAAQKPHPEVDPAEFVAVKSVGFLFAACAAAHVEECQCSSVRRSR